MLNNLTRVCAGVSLNEAYDVYADTCLTRAQVSVCMSRAAPATSQLHNAVILVLNV